MIVDYLGVAHELKEALNFYSQSGGKGDLTLDQQVAIGLLLTKLEVVEGVMEAFDYQPYFIAALGTNSTFSKRRRTMSQTRKSKTASSMP